MRKRAVGVDFPARTCETAGVSQIEFVVEEAENGLRLDVVLVKRVPGMSRAAAKRFTSEGQVRVNGRVQRKGAPLAAGDKITLAEPPPTRDFVAAPDTELALEVLYEDAHFVAVAKSAGVPSHPLREGEGGTVAGALVARYPEMAGVGYSPREPGILHRLDTDTSGVLLAARTKEAFDALRDALRGGLIDKRYRALCLGEVVAPQTITIPLAPHPKDRRRVLACVHERDVARLRPRVARTEVLEGEAVGVMTLVEAAAPTAGRHQIRVHLAAIGHPLGGDALYGGPEIDGLDRHFLHASEVRLAHPIDGRSVFVKAPLPADLVAALETVRGRA